MIFNHIHHEIPKIRRTTSPDGSRVYETPTGLKYPSITSVTGLLKKQQIIEWRKAVGEEEANRVSRRAASRGTRIHSLCESYLLNKPTTPSMFDVDAFKGLTPLLNEINNIRCLETQLYSDALKVAGTVDCIADFRGRRSVIDFKTSRRIKTRDDIHDYFMQTSAYAVMFEERTQIAVDQLVILMSVDNDSPLVFIEKRDDWIDGFKELRSQYEKWKGV